jgi:HAD superfamily hydrolase (TIGR01509 family)
MRAVIFDVDGTLVDSVDLHARAWQEAFTHFGYDTDYERVRSQIGKGGDQLLPVFLPAEVARERGREIEEYRTRLYRREYLGKVRAFPAVRPLFERLLADGWKVALASSAKGEELTIYKNLCGIGDLLHAETSSDDAERSKPHPDIFQAAVERLRVSAGDCVVVGDSPYDAEAAGKAGIASIGFLSGGFPRQELEAAGFGALYDGPADLLTWYEGSFFARQAPRIG